MNISDPPDHQGLMSLRAPCPTRAAIRAALASGEDVSVVTALAGRPQRTPPINLKRQDQAQEGL